MGHPSNEEIMQTARVNALSPWFDQQLGSAVNNGAYRQISEIVRDTDQLVRRLSDHRQAIARSDVAIGMSGGLDSALTAALFQAAGWTVRPLLMPIHQDAVETDRGRMVCEALGLPSITIDLSDEYDRVSQRLTSPSVSGEGEDAYQLRIRQGNMRARLRMITLYDHAQANNGVVASTDNLSELTAGFWTLHGDVGDIAPIQSYNKSWDVPKMASYMKVPKEVIYAKPTDGLGIASGDEDQLGCSYLEWDIIMHVLLRNVMVCDHQDRTTSGKIMGGSFFDLDRIIEDLTTHASDDDKDKVNRIIGRMRATSFKHMNPYNYDRAHNALWMSVLNAAQLLARSLGPALPS